MFLVIVILSNKSIAGKRKLYLRNVSCNCCVLQAKSKAQKDCGSKTSIPFLISTGGFVKIGAALPKNGYVYLQKK